MAKTDRNEIRALVTQVLKGLRVPFDDPCDPNYIFTTECIEVKALDTNNFVENVVLNGDTLNFTSNGGDAFDDSVNLSSLKDNWGTQVVEILDSTTLNLSGDGTPGTPIRGDVIFPPGVTDGTVTKVTGGTNVSVSGTGSSTTPYVVNATYPTLQTVSNSGITFTGNGTAGSPLAATVNFPTVVHPPRTVVTAGTNVTVTGDGQPTTPYVVNANFTESPDVLATIVPGQNTTVNGTGTAANPYQINATTATVVGGTGINVTGIGTASQPYIVTNTSATNDYVSQVALSGNSLVFTGLGNAFNNSVDLSSLIQNTVVTPGTNVTITGTGSTANPYVVNAAASVDSYTSGVSLVGDTLQITGTNSSFNGGINLAGLRSVVQAGANITVTGAGTTANPYIVSGQAAGGGPTTDAHITNVTFAGDNISFSSADGAFNGNVDLSGLRTVLAPGTNTTLTGVGTAADPYKVNTVHSIVSDGSLTGDGTPGNPLSIADPTVVTAGTNVTVTGAGTTANPYIVNSTGGGTGGDNWGTQTVVTDNDYILGDGTTANVLTLNGESGKHFQTVISDGTAVATPGETKYIRIGNFVHVSGIFIHQSNDNNLQVVTLTAPTFTGLTLNSGFLTVATSGGTNANRYQAGRGGVVGGNLEFFFFLPPSSNNNVGFTGVLEYT